jgi:SAM-dependent methyltransferase
MKRAKTMDPIAEYNKQRWAALVQANAIFTRPRLDLDEAAARALVDPEGRLGDVRGKRVLCLASGGGQQSVAFALLGAQVTVVDLCAEQLERDRAAAAHYGLAPELVQADMRDLSALPAAAFDLVYHPYSINFVPDTRVVFREVARRLHDGGMYHFHCANPCFAGLLLQEWDGKGYPLRRPYVDGAEVHYIDESWVFGGETPAIPIDGPREYKHTLGTLINGLIEQGFVIQRVVEEDSCQPDITAAPGTAEHFVAIAPPILRFWAIHRQTPAGPIPSQAA